MGDVHPNAVKVEFLEALAKLAPGDLSQTILSSSGAEAVESALKTARLATGRPGGDRVSKGLTNGLSYGTLPATDRAEMKAPFDDQLCDWVIYSPFPDPLRHVAEERCLDSLEQFLKSNASLRAPVGALLIEPVQGRGGVRIPKPALPTRVCAISLESSIWC